MSKDLRTSELLQPRWGALPPPPCTVYHVINYVSLVIFRSLHKLSNVYHIHLNMMRKQEKIKSMKFWDSRP